MDTGDRDFAGTTRFEIRRRLGAGGMGVVYQAFDRQERRDVALKTLREVSARTIERLEREFEALRGIEHRNLVRMGELFQDGGQCFFTMELVSGVDFLSYVRLTTSRYDEPRLRSALKQLAQGIHALHRAGKVHRDIKPSNLLVCADGRVVLLDFGLATEVEPEVLSDTHEMVGTADYMAPEQSTGEAGTAADWYSLGVVLYQSLTGRSPHSGKTSFEILSKRHAYPPAPPRQCVAEVPADLDQLCVELLAIEPERRPSGAQILERLGADAPAEPAPGPRSTAFTQAMPFVGRRAELELLRQAFDDSQADQAVTVFVHGASGLGKSELVRHFTQGLVANDPKVCVFAGRCYEHLESSYRAFQGIADQLGLHIDGLPPDAEASLMPADAGLLPQLFPILSRVKSIAVAPLMRIDQLDPHEQRRRLFSCFRDLLHRQALSRPTVMVIDDAQWAGADTLAMMSEVMHPPYAPPLLLLVTARPGMQEVWKQDGVGEVRHLHLGGLEASEAAELVRSLASGLDREQAQAVAREAEGHPLFIVELLRHLERSDAGAPLKLDDALWARVERLPDAARSLLEFLAVAGAPVTLTTARDALDLGAAELRLAERLLRSGFLARGERHGETRLLGTYHDRVREATVSRLSAEGRAARHSQIAFGLERAGAATSEPQLLVRHCEAAGQFERAAAHAEKAAKHASSMAAFDRAAELYGTALRLGKTQGVRQRELRLARAVALANAGRGPEAAEAFISAADGADSVVAVDCQKRAAELWIVTGYLERGLRVSASLLASVGEPMAKTQSRALASLLWHRLRLRLARKRPADRSGPQVDRSTLMRLDVVGSMGLGLALIDPIHGADFNARFLLQARRARLPLRLARALSLEAVFLASQGGRAARRGRAHAAEVAALASAHPDDGYLAAYALIADGNVSYLHGQFAAACDRLEEAELGFANENGDVFWELTNARTFRIFCLRQLGAFSKARHLSAASLRDARRRGDRYLETTVRMVGTDAVLAHTGPDEAERQLGLASWTPPEEGVHLQHWYELEARGAIALYRGRASVALAELAEPFVGIEKSLLMRVQIIRAISRWLRARLLLSAAAADPAQRADLASVARMIRRLAREKIGYATVYSLLLRAAHAALTADGDDAATSEALALAIEAADANDMAHCAAAARYRRGKLLGGEQGAELLAAAKVWFDREEVLDPARFVEIVAPGFPKR